VLHPLNPKRNRTRLAVRTQHRVEVKIIRAVETLVDGKMRNQGFKIHPHSVVDGAQFQGLKRLQQAQAVGKRVIADSSVDDAEDSKGYDERQLRNLAPI
jgi:hypothetical protein